MYVTLNGHCEKIVCTQQKEKTVIYNGDKIQIENKMPISISSIVTQKSEVWKCICKFPLQLIGVIFDILLMNYEWDWIENFEPCTFLIDNYFCDSSCDYLEIEYNKSRFDKESKKVIMPQIIINGKEIKEIKCHVYTENLKVCFLKCCLKMIGILIWGLLPLIIITINVGKDSVYMLLLDLGITFMMAVKMLFEYQKFCGVKRQLIYQKQK